MYVISISKNQLLLNLIWMRFKIFILDKRLIQTILNSDPNAVSIPHTLIKSWREVHYGLIVMGIRADNYCIFPCEVHEIQVNLLCV